MYAAAGKTAHGLDDCTLHSHTEDVFVAIWAGYIDTDDNVSLRIQWWHRRARRVTCLPTRTPRQC